jgi:hypothetical protein
VNVLAVKLSMLPRLLAEIREALREEQTLISLAAAELPGHAKHPDGGGRGRSGGVTISAVEMTNLQSRPLAQGLLLKFSNDL